MNRRTFEEMVSYFNQTVADMDIDRKYKMELLGMITAILQRHDEDMKHAPTIERKTGEWMNDPITNADRIRTMTDEELAEMFERWITNCDCNFTPCVEYCDMFDGKTCKERWLGWLKKVVEK